MERVYSRKLFASKDSKSLSYWKDLQGKSLLAKIRSANFSYPCVFVMKCPNCEEEIKDEEAVYCPRCGLNLEESMVLDEEAEEAERKKRVKVMKKLSKVDKEELLSRGIPREKIALIREDLRREFLEGNLGGLPILVKDCVFQTYSKKLGKEEPKKGILCGLTEQKRCIKEICPLYQAWKKT